MRKVTILGLVALVILAMTSCMHVKIDGDNLLRKHRNETPTQVHQVGQPTAMQAFDEVNVAGPFNIILEQGEGNIVRIEGTMEQLEKMTVYVKEGELYVDQRKNEPSGTFDGLRVFVTMPMLEGIDLASSGSVTAPKALVVNDLSLEVAGSGEITLAQLTCKELGIDIAGSGDVTLGPVQATLFDADIAGSGNVDVAALTCPEADSEIAGSGNITLNNMNVEHAKSDIAGSGNIILRGKVGTHDKDIAGSGRIDVSGLNIQ